MYQSPRTSMRPASEKEPQSFTQSYFDKDIFVNGVFSIPYFLPSLDFSRSMVVSVTPSPQHQSTPLSERGGACSNAYALDPRTVMPLLKAAAAVVTAAGCRAGQTSRVSHQRFPLCWTGCRRLAVTCCRAGVTGSCTWTRRCSYTCSSRTPPR